MVARVGPAVSLVLVRELGAEVLVAVVGRLQVSEARACAPAVEVAAA